MKFEESFPKGWIPPKKQQRYVMNPYLFYMPFDSSWFSFPCLYFIFILYMFSLFLSLYFFNVYINTTPFLSPVHLVKLKLVFCYFSFPPPLFCLRQPYQSEGGEPATHQKGQASRCFKKLGARKDRGMVRTSTGGWFRNPVNQPVDMVISFFPLFER